MSRFIDLLEKAGQPPPAILGFAPASSGQGAAPQIVLVARLLPEELVKDPGLAEAKVDAFLVADELAEGASLDAVAKALGKTPWGVRLVEGRAAQVRQLIEKGCDFIVFESMDTEAAVLNEEDLGTVVTLGSDLGEEVIRSTCELPVDGALLSPAQRTLPLTVEKLIAIQRVRGLTDKPLIVEAPQGLGQGDLEALRNMGIGGLIVDIRPLDKIAEIRELIGNLPRPKTRPSRSDALIPYSGGEVEVDLAGPGEEGDEDDF